jgi:hypothetical protein
MTAAKRCPRCRQVKAASQFYRRRGGRQLSSYCRPCAQVAAREAHSRRHDPAAGVRLRAVDRARQRRRRSLGRQEGGGR